MGADNRKSCCALLYLTLHMVSLASDWKQDGHTRAQVRMKKPLVGLRQQEHRREESSATTWSTNINSTTAPFTVQNAQGLA